MAPKVVVPADFGIENLHSQFHGNVVLKLQGGEDMKANSLILSYHSSVFVHLFLELQQSVLEMEDFVGEAVKSFLGALYSGEIQLVRHLFRDVNKLCHVFKVEWLSGRCWDYFTGLVGGVSVHTDYQTLLFLFEEARFCMRVMKCDKFVDLVVQKICGLENRAEIFVQPYMKNYSELETSQLDLMIQITKYDNPKFLLKIMKTNLENEGGVFNKASRYLLENVDLCKCIADDGVFFEELFDVLDSATKSSDSDAFLVNKLYRKSVRELKKTQPACSSGLSTSALSVSENPLRSPEIPNIFCSFAPFRKVNPQEFLDLTGESPLVMNLYMLIEGFVAFQYNSNFEVLLTPNMVHKIEQIRRKREWSRISPEFLELWHDNDVKEVKTIKENGYDLTSKEESVRRIGRTVGLDNEITMINKCKVRDLFYCSQSFAFYFKHPNTRDCNLPGKCGFLLKFTPDKKSGKPHKFKVNLCLDQQKYPEGLHIHSEFVKAEKIHLVPLIELNCGMRYYLATFTWNEFGISEMMQYCDDERSLFKWKVGSAYIYPGYYFKLSAFITL